MIAAEAGLTLPVIAYHFGSKEGLHRACALEIVEQYRRRLLPLVAAAREAADDGSLSTGDAQLWLTRILEGLVTAITAEEEQRLATDFVLREMTEQGPGYSLLYDQLWSPGLRLVADLLAAAKGRNRDEAHEVEALLLIASLSAFTKEQPVSLAFLGWDQVDPSRHSLITASMKQLLNGLLTKSHQT
jgi:AcrR family transcriptional regulator